MKAISGSQTIDTSDPVAKMIDDGASYYISQLPGPDMISQDQMRNWNFPLYVAFADKSGVHDSLKAAKTAKENLKKATVRIWKNASHSLPMEYPHELDQEIIGFIEKSDKPSQA